MGNKELSIRERYERQGVENYYEKNSETYVNPHESQIKDLLIRNIDKFDSNSVLDLCCGGGEVTRVLLEKGIENVIGADPYTCELYTRNTKKHCTNLSFKDILGGKMTRNYTTIICSFALHLLGEENLFMIVNQLFKNTKTIVIIAPHKRPFLERIPGVILKFIDFSLTPKGKKVYLRIYGTE